MRLNLTMYSLPNATSPKPLTMDPVHCDSLEALIKELTEGYTEVVCDRACDAVVCGRLGLAVYWVGKHDAGKLVLPAEPKPKPVKAKPKRRKKPVKESPGNDV